MNDETPTLERLLNWFEALPAEVYLVLALSVLGIALAAGIAQAMRVSRERRQHADHRRRAERELKLRHDVYLPAAEALARAQEFLANYPLLDLGREGARAVADHVVGALGKVHLVGTERVIRATNAVSTEFTNASLSLAAKRRPLEAVEHEIEQIDKRAEHLGFERDQLLANLTRVASDGLEQMDGVWSDLNLRFDKLHREIAGVLERRQERVRERDRLREQLALEAARASLRIARLAVPAYLALRQELDLPLDEDEYRMLAKRTIREIENQLAEMKPKEAPSSAAAAEPAVAEQQPAARLKMALRRR